MSRRDPLTKAMLRDPRGFDRRRAASARGRRRSDVGPSRTALLAAGFVGGLVVGAAAWGGMLAGSRRRLFSRNPVHRFVAISYLATRPSVDTARLLRDYVRWEPNPLLRRRGRQALAAVEASLAR